MWLGTSSAIRRLLLPKHARQNCWLRKIYWPGALGREDYAPTQVVLLCVGWVCTAVPARSTV
ncbi:unnamed protein product [Prunus armeniaca]